MGRKFSHGPFAGTVFRIGDFGARGRAEASAPKGWIFNANQVMLSVGVITGPRIRRIPERF
jgi:hypothetical protein